MMVENVFIFDSVNHNSLPFPLASFLSSFPHFSVTLIETLW